MKPQRRRYNMAWRNEKSELQTKAQADAIAWGVTALLARIANRNPQPGDIWPAVLNNAAEKQAQDLWGSLLTLGVRTAWH